MSAYPVTDERYPPTYSVRFTSFASQIVLHADASNGGSAPTDVNHLPSQVVVQVGAANQHLDYIDAGGAVVALTFPLTGSFPLRMAPVSFETTSTVAAVTVFWNQKG
jgi:hypothetical protein